MDKRDIPLGSITYGGDGPFETPTRVSNDLKSLDDRFADLLSAYAFWKYMPPYRVKRMDLSQRIVLRDMQARVARFELETGTVI